MSALPATSDDGAFWPIWLSPYVLPTVTAADEVGTFAALSGQARTTADLATDLGVNARALGIHLGLLAALGLVERRGGLWQATALARTWMHPEAEGYFGPLLFGFRDSLPLHRQLVETLRTGDRATGHASSAAEWERGELPQDMAHRIAAFMNSHSVASSKAAARLPLFSEVRSLLDVGAGSGIFAIELARAWSQLSSTLLDIDTMCIAAQAFVDKAGMAHRVRTQPLDMFRRDWPQGHDAHFFSNVFHDWSEDTNRMLAAKSFAALPSGGRILLHEILMNDDGCGPLIGAAFSVLMLLGTHGKQYTFAELRDILESTGFVDVTTATTGSGGYSIVSARKP